MKRTIFTIFLFLLFSIPAFANQPVNPAVLIRELFGQAMEAYSRGDYQRSADTFKQLIKISPKFAPAYNYLGLVEKELGTDYHEIMKMFEQATILKPDYAEAYENLGKVYYGLGQYDKAEENMNKAISLNANLNSSHLALGWIYLLGKSDPKDAIVHFESVVKAVPSDYAYLGLGMAYFMNDERYKVLDIITKLRGSGNERYATELENMIRNKHYIPSQDLGLPLINYSKAGDNKSVEKLPTEEEINAKYDGSMKVRLVDKPVEQPVFTIPSLGDESPRPTRASRRSRNAQAKRDEDSRPTRSGSQRIRELQQRWENVSTDGSKSSGGN